MINAIAWRYTVQIGAQGILLSYLLRAYHEWENEHVKCAMNPARTGDLTQRQKGKTCFRRAIRFTELREVLGEGEFPLSYMTSVHTWGPVQACRCLA